MKKRILSIVLCLSMLIATFATTMVVSAAEVNAETGYCADISDYRAEGNFTAPTKDGVVFAGWYKDADFTEAIAPSVKSGAAYAKFVDPTVFTIQNQFNKEAHKTSATVDLRIITTIDSEWYAGIEILFTCAGKEGTAVLPIDTVYTSLVNYESAKTQFCNDSAYFAVEKITGIPKEVYTKEISITPVFTTYDGTVFEGTTRGTAEDKLVLKEKLELGTSEFTVREDSDNTWIVFNWGEVKDEIPNGAMWGTAQGTWLEGGVYLDGDSEPAWVRLYKNDCHYMLFRDMGWTIKEGTRITIKGIYQHGDGSQIKIAPATFMFTNGSWIKLSAEQLEMVTLSFTGDTDPSRLGASTLFFTTSKADDLMIYDRYWTVWAEIYRNGTERTNLQLIHWAANQYYISFGEAQPVGTTISIQGTLTDEYVGGTGNTVTFWPTTFTLREGGVWEITSREPIVPVE